MTPSPKDLIPFALTVRQVEVLEAVEREGGQRAAARALKCNAKTISQVIEACKKRAAVQGFSPEHDMTHVAPDPFLVKGVSTYYGKDGKPQGQWVKTKLDDERREEMIRAVVAAMSQDIKREPAVKKPGHALADLCTLYTLTDCHVGMRAWGKETGADWDLEIAEKTLVGGVSHMVGAATPSKVGIVAQLGDWLHWDSLTAETPTSGHPVDSDSRYSKVVQASIRILRTAVKIALSKHERVVLLVCEGNHDLSGSVWMRHLFSTLYENEPRVTVVDSELPYYVYQHGKTMIGWHHGHLKKMDQLPGLFAAQFPKIWGETTRRYAHMGHLHHVHEKEHPGMTVIQHPTIAARDSYAARGGWIADRQLTAITYHTEWGQVGRHTVVPEMILEG